MFEPCKITEYNFIPNKQITSRYNISILYRVWEKYVILVQHCRKWTRSRLPVLKGSKYYKNVEKAYNFRIKSETGKWSVRGKLTGSCLFLHIMLHSK